MSNLRLNLVVAACNNNGIGINGKLPWSLRKDMQFFKKITSDTNIAGKENAVIMGRKTWFGIPEKFRPLKNRVNIVLSRELKEVPEGVYVCRSLPEAIDLVKAGRVGEIEIENVHIIGGSSVYEECLTGPYDCRVYLTRIFADFECDTFMPALDENAFRKVENPSDIPSTEEQEEKGIKFRFEVYDKIATVTPDLSGFVSLNLSATVNNQINTDNMECTRGTFTDQSKVRIHPITTADQSKVGTYMMADSVSQSKTATHQMISSKDQSEAGPQTVDSASASQLDMATHHIKGQQPIKFNIMAAMCSDNRGMGFGQKLPWPSLRRDYEYYTKKTSTFAGECSEDKMIVHISGRKTWEACGNHERYLKNVRRIVISGTITNSGDIHPGILKVVPSFAAALEYCNSPGVREKVDSAWVMGGAGIYEEALHHPQCDRLYLTHVYTTFPANVFFPAFEPWFEEISNANEGPGVIEENGVEYEFKVYRKSDTNV